MFYSHHLTMPIILQQKFNRGASYSCSQWIGHKCRTVHKSIRLIIRYRMRYFICRQYCRECHISTCQRLTDTHDIRLYFRPFPRKEFSGSSETGCYLIKNQQHLMFTTKTCCLTKILGMIEAHTTCPLNNRFEYQCSDLIPMLFQRLFQWKYIMIIPLSSKSG